jgi:hypothetical protein
MAQVARHAGKTWLINGQAISKGLTTSGWMGGSGNGFQCEWRPLTGG